MWFAQLYHGLHCHGYMARCGQLIDASIVSAPIQHITQKEKEIIDEQAMPVEWTPPMRRQHDIEARWTKKHGKSYFGYRLSANVDKLYKFIRCITVCPANESDTRHFEDVLDPTNTSNEVYADCGYVDGKWENRLTAQGLRIHIQRKGKVGRELSETQRNRNRRIAKPRA